MNSIQLQIMLIAVIVSVAAAIPGVFLVLRGMALMSDAISHAVLLGIAIMFLFVHNLDSPLLLVGAALAGMATVFLTESVIQTRRLKEDAAIGIVFPLFFSCGVILISLFARDVHLDIDMVILGEIAFAPFNRFYLFGRDLGPAALWSMGTILLLNSAFVYVFYKELKAALFDNDFAAVAGLAPTILYYGLMFLTSITAVGAFDIVGSIVVVALMIAPAATAYLLADRLETMLGMSVVFAVISSLLGYGAAAYYDVSIAGSIATMSGVVFVAVLLCAPGRGLLARAYAERQEHQKIAEKIMYDFLGNSLDKRSSLVILGQQLGWGRRYTKRIAASLVHAGRAQETQGVVTLIV
jgi:manganese/zinc/iron transport system permease protein